MDHQRLEPRRRPRQVRAELTRARILRAAAHVFAEQGYAAGTTNRIAERAGVSIGSLYQYFPNKDALLAELLTRHPQDGIDAHAATGPPAGPLEGIVRTMVSTAIANHRDDPRLLRLMIEEAPRSQGLLQRVEDHWRERVAALRAVLAGHPEVGVEDVDTAARIIASAIELVVHQLVATPDPADPARLEDELVAMVTAYLTRPVERAGRLLAPEPEGGRS